MSPQLHERIAKALGWTVIQTYSFSALTLRDLIRPVSPKLAHEITEEIHNGGHVVSAIPDQLIDELDVRGLVQMNDAARNRSKKRCALIVTA